MNREAVLHQNTEEFIYPVSRNALIVKLRAARKDLASCTLVHWARTTPGLKKRIPLHLAQRDSLFDYFEARVSFSKPARYRKYYFELLPVSGNPEYLGAYGFSDSVPEGGFFEFLYANSHDIVSVPKWAQGAVYYQIFPERFRDGDPGNNRPGCVPWGSVPTRENFMGGDLAGIIEKLGYIAGLGITCLYLTPIFQADYNHKYATTDYFAVDRDFGTASDLKRLVELCHSRGIRVVLDGVFNHVGVDFAAFRDVLERQEDSAYKDWFHITRFPVSISHHDYECVGAYKWMPKLNTGNREVREFILSVMKYWIEEAGIDGWRLDVADELDPALVQEAHLRVKEISPDILLLGETWGFGTRLIGGCRLDCVMNYVFRDCALDFFARRRITSAELDDRVNRMLARYPGDVAAALYNPLDSHDTPRFLTECGGRTGLLKLACAFMFLFPGSPAVFYGDEIGLIGDNDPDCRKAMEWESARQNTELLAWYKRLIDLRHRERVLREGSFVSCLCGGGSVPYGFVRIHGGEVVYAVFNPSDMVSPVLLPLVFASPLVDLLDGTVVPYSAADGTEGFHNQDMLDYRGKAELTLGPESIGIMKQRRNTE